MPCHVARYQHIKNGDIGWAVVDTQASGDLCFYAIKGNYDDTQSFLRHGKDLAFSMASQLRNYEHKLISIAAINVLSPISKPCRILCQGSNYPQSRIETGMDPNDKSFNTIFHKSDTSITGPTSDIIRPSHVQLLDYEIELGIVIGEDISTAVELSKDNLHRFIAGIVMVHDVTARDIQIPQGQYFKGKSYRTFCPTGPFLCLLGPDEMHYLESLSLQLTVNGELRQSDTSGNMIYSPHETLSELSKFSDLKPGDLLLTGSPGGCALTVPSGILIKLLGLLPDTIKWKAFINKQSKNDKYLQPNDLIESTIVSADRKINLGTQRNLVISE
ncbi:fumarylacetoacetate hydrolase family protein [Pseudomaricurvus alkylphenolicus]|uniref:fumarylacetoacetate hydrolase family protein n=1 Tax=Pseudomaricurvus alkylphenolicus TaxID=1306991 RepID=UPI00141FB20D|nr:fumarylacetoacetate hydrolase family protein [Pseudomaricurvus alkylphenolicus]NIB43525.1 fumarylacetoacetate hydrolase family protein [Pseudomaricurvus alkylphenolicus]